MIRVSDPDLRAIGFRIYNDRVLVIFFLHQIHEFLAVWVRISSTARAACTEIWRPQAWGALREFCVQASGRRSYTRVVRHGWDLYNSTMNGCISYGCCVSVRDCRESRHDRAGKRSWSKWWWPSGYIFLVFAGSTTHYASPRKLVWCLGVFILLLIISKKKLDD